MPEALRIAMLCLHSCPMGRLGGKDTGGMNVYVRVLSRALAKIGIQVDIFTRAHQLGESMISFPGVGVRLVHIPAGAPLEMDKMEQYAYLPELVRNLAAFTAHESGRYDLIHSHYWLSGEAGQDLSQLWRIPHLTMFHTLGAVKAGVSVERGESHVRLTAEKDIIQSCRGVIAATGREKGDLVRLYGAMPEKVVVIPCGVDLERFQPQERLASRRRLGLPEDGQLLLYVGRVEPLKGIDRIIRSLSLLDGSPQTRLLVVGGDEQASGDAAALKELAGQLGLGGRVLFRGAVPQPELPYYYSAADVTVVASYYESFCLVILESLACGTPVVSTDVGVAASVIVNGENGELTADNDPVRFSAALARALASDYSPAERKEAIRASVAGYGWDVVAERVAAEYRAALG
jgi:D-inositol-3-phosphate glycosyltransferase